MQQPHLDLNIALLHENMVDKNGKLVTTSVTLIDIHDISRSARTFGVNEFYLAHPAVTIKALVTTLRDHWEDGFGATYNPNRKDALERLRIVDTLDDAIKGITDRTGKSPLLVATSARPGADRITFNEFDARARESNRPILVMFGTGWGMSPELLSRADLILEPIDGPTEYNHLSVRSAVAIILDRITRK